MSERRLLLVGATGLIGSRVMEQASDNSRLRLIALARREMPMPRGAKMEMLVADPAHWPDAIARLAPDVVICALGTTWRKAGRTEAAFRAVDHDLPLAVAGAAIAAGCEGFVLVSSVGADPQARGTYLRVKGETEAAIAKLGFRRLDTLRPGLLRGSRTNDRRFLERVGKVASPLTDRLLRGSLRRYRSIDANAVAAAALQCAREKAQGRFVHENDGIERLARRWKASE